MKAGFRGAELCWLQMFPLGTITANSLCFTLLCIQVGGQCQETRTHPLGLHTTTQQAAIQTVLSRGSQDLLNTKPVRDCNDSWDVILQRSLSSVVEGEISIPDAIYRPSGSLIKHVHHKRKCKISSKPHQTPKKNHTITYDITIWFQLALMCDVQWTNLLNKERDHNLKMKWLHVAEIKTNKVSVYRKRYVNPKFSLTEEKRASDLHKNGHNDFICKAGNTRFIWY